MMEQLSPLDGIRGLCSLIIVSGHFFTFWVGPSDTSASWPLFGIEYLSPVTLFFVLSGFTFVHVYDRQEEAKYVPIKQEEGQDGGSPLLLSNLGPAASSAAPLFTWEEKKTFFRRRIARLAPIYYLGLALAIVPMIIYQDKWAIITSVPLSLVWLQALTCNIGNQWNGPLWTASAFAFAYLCFPSLLAWLRLKSLRHQFAVLAFFSVLSVAICITWTSFLGVGSWVFFLHAFAVFRVPHFIVGMSAAFISKKLETLPFSTTCPWLLAEFCTLILVTNQVVCVLGTANNSSFYFPYMYFIEFAFPPVFALWLIGLTHKTANSGLTRFFFSLLPLRKLGDVSYALYCLHWPTLNWYAWAIAGSVSFNAVPMADGIWWYFRPWQLGPALVVCLTVASIAHWLLEQPARQAIRKSR